MDQFSSHPLYKKHNIDSAMSSLWDFYKRKFLPLFLVSFVMALIMQYLSTLVNIAELQTITDPVVLLEKMKDFILPMLIISVINLLFLTMLHYYVIYNPLNGDDNFFKCAFKSLRYFIPYMIIMVLLAFFGSFAILLGLIALIIGVFISAIYLMTIFLFILPVMMVEGSNIANTISRTITLAHRNFWSNFGWTAVFIIILLVISVILSGIILLPFTGTFMKAFVNPQEAANLVELTNNPLFIILSAVVNALTFPLLPIFASILYFNGKAREEVPLEITTVTDDFGKVRVEDLYAKPYSDDHPEKPENNQ
jgi:hypothetical protein